MIAILLAATALCAQTFDSATVKSAPGAQLFGPAGNPPAFNPGRISSAGTTLAALLQNAYNIKLDQISGPAWLTTAPYAIDARFPADATREDSRLMLQHLLTERFQLTLHHETKEFAVYDLVVAKGGPKLKPATSVTPADNDGFPVIPPGLKSWSATNHGIDYISYHGATMNDLATSMVVPVSIAVADKTFSTRVFDKTDLPDTFDFRLSFTASLVPADTVNAPDIFTAIQQQLGLKLVPARAHLDIIVIDHAEKTPTEN